MGDLVGGLVQDKSSYGILARPEVTVVTGLLETGNDKLGGIVGIGVDYSVVGFQGGGSDEQRGEGSVMLCFTEVKVQSVLEDGLILFSLSALELQVELGANLADVGSFLEEMKRPTTPIAVAGEGFSEGSGALMSPRCPIFSDMPRFEERIAIGVGTI